MALDYVESVPLFDNGDSITGYCDADVAGARFLMIHAASAGGLPTVRQNDGTKAVVGISAHAALSGTTVGIHHARSIVTQVLAGAALTAGQLVASDATGQAIPFVSGTTGPACGTAYDDAASGALAAIDRETF